VVLEKKLEISSGEWHNNESLLNELNGKRELIV